MGIWIPLGALVISASTLLLTAWTNRTKAIGAHAIAIEARLKAAEEEIARCTADRADLRTQLFQNMQDLIELRRTGGAGTKKAGKRL